MRKLLVVCVALLSVAFLYKAEMDQRHTWQQGHSPSTQVAEMYYLYLPSWKGDKPPCTLYGMKDSTVRLYPEALQHQCQELLRYLPDTVKVRFRNEFHFWI